MYDSDSPVLVQPFSRQRQGNQIVIGLPAEGVFLALPEEAVELLDLLGAGHTVRQAQEIYRQKYGETPDLVDLLEALELRGIVLPPGSAADRSFSLPGGDPERPATTASGQGRKFHFERIPDWLPRLLFGRAGLTVYGSIIALAGALCILHPGLIPGRSAVYFATDRTIKITAMLLLSYLGIFIHEMGHLLSARAAGVRSRLGIGHRLWFLVAETDLTGLWAISSRARYLPFLAGPLFDLTTASGILLVVYGQSRGWLSLAPPVLEILRAMCFVYFMQLLWQFFFFVRTDIYYVIANFFGCMGLMKDTEDFLRNRLAAIFSSVRLVDQSHISAREMKVIRSYSGFWLAGRVLAFSMLFLVTIPVYAKYLVSIYLNLRAGFAHGWYPLLDSIVMAILFLAPFSLGFSMWIRSLLRKRKNPYEARTLPA